MSKKSLLLIDGSGFIFRAYHALPPLNNPQGIPVGAVVGFINMVTKLIDGSNATHVAVIFDAARVTFRNRIYPEYKANRPPAPEDLVPQFAIVKDATRALNLPAIELADYEADDIIATYARCAKEQGIEVTIVSSDKDLMQLISDGVAMFDAMKNKPIGQEQVFEKFGVKPDKVLEVLSLIGDSSDNVPGVAGIGPKTAAELIKKYGDLENLLANAGEIKQQKRRETLLASADIARLSKQLITLKDDVPLPFAIDDLIIKKPDQEVLISFLTEHGFKGLLAKLVASSQKSVVSEATAQTTDYKLQTTNYQIISTLEALQNWIEIAKKSGKLAFDTETTSLNIGKAELVGFSLCVDAGKACYVPLGHKWLGGGNQELGDLFAIPVQQPATNNQQQIPLEQAVQAIKPILEDESILKIGQNIKYDILIMQKYGVVIKSYDDTMLLSYCLHAGEHGQGMDELAMRYLGVKTISYDEVTGMGKNRLSFSEVDIEKAGNYAAEDADITMRLWNLFKPQVTEAKLLTLYETIERPLISVLVDMETKGIKVDLPYLSSLSKDFSVRMKEYEIEIYKLAGREFNIASPKQLGEILFDELKLEGGKKTGKTEAYATGVEVLEELAEAGHELPQKVLDWRGLAKLKSTYTDSLATQINAKTGRVHTSFAMAITATGRLSSNDPNLQNIPIRSIDGKKIRHAFIAEKNNILMAADYSQIELRLLAHIADIPSLKEAFRNGDDIHAITASQMFGVPVSEVGSDLRRKAKTINFGIIYGISSHGLALRLGISRTEAGQYIEKYFAKYCGIKDYMESCKEFARQNGYVETLFGRRCHTPLINDKNGSRRQFAERAAINAPLQGTAADIIKKAMIAIDKKITPDCKMLLQVHDELVFEVAEDAVEDAKKLIKYCMENATQLSIPLTVEIGIGKNWGQAH